jgi:hypothetical protein
MIKLKILKLKLIFILVFRPEYKEINQNNYIFMYIRFIYHNISLGNESLIYG